MYDQNYNPFAQNLAIIKGYFKRPTILILGILQIVSLVLAIPASVMTSRSMASFMSMLLPQLIDDPSVEISQVIRQMQTNTLTSTISSIIPSVIISALIAAAFILIYVKSRNDSPDSTPMVGFTILYVMSIIELVFVSLAALMALLAMLILAAAVSFGVSMIGDDAIAGFSTAFVVILFVILAVAIGVLLFTSINRLRFYSNIRKSMTEVELSRKGALPFGVICVISAVSGGLSLVGTILSTALIGTVLPNILIQSGVVINLSGDLAPLMIFSILSSALSLLYTIFMAKLALGYKSYIDSVKIGYTPAYVPEQPSAMPPVPPVDFIASAQPAQPAEPVEFQPAPPNDTDYIIPTAADPDTCPSCGALVYPDNAFCSNCGTKLR